jgi:hypothetical protein
VLSTNPDVVARRMHEEVVLVHLRTNRIYTLNSTAGRFWELLDSGMGREAVKRALGEEFDIDGVDLDQEIDIVIDELLRQGLVVSDGNA